MAKKITGLLLGLNGLVLATAGIAALATGTFTGPQGEFIYREWLIYSAGLGLLLFVVFVSKIHIKKKVPATKHEGLIANRSPYP
ncbi:MAG TPA: hypothetical protein HA252_00705 [Candidatus Diapherotrites archaeon]|uniref:Uncharacterized protein n=1 Tax=Candidatus Iainarchaeum sp. TaxID=3101447 RepID=A0A7J4JH82_9ARCH|nr:hypothetical protein [Candidatus Diapherotrites archaeon]HIH15909.1 hypothetical protein [Candidatus Diapherotrites archaeon]